MRIAIPQLNYYTGNIRKNYELLLNAIKKGREARADLIVFPESAICGPFPQDLLEKEDFIEECRLAIDQLAEACGPMAAIIGGPNFQAQNGIMYNSAYFICNGEVNDGVHKTILSDYDIFNESRYFIAGEDNAPIRYRNKNIRILFDEYESEFIGKDDHLLLYIGLSPFTLHQQAEREKTFATISKKYAKPLLSVNATGGYTSVLFDGNSMVYNARGQQIMRLKEFGEDFTVIDTEKLNQLPVRKEKDEEEISRMHTALITGIRDYFAKHGFQKAILGLSGGIDSALVATLAAEALGKENVTGILMPSEFSTDHSIQDATDLARNLGITYQTLPVKSIYDAYLKVLEPLFKDTLFNVAEENLQARIRGALVMALSNKFGYIALNTSNKSEIAVGYGTLYGDMCGSLSVIGDVYKTDVYRLARYINRKQPVIPENTISKAPSAELRPGQKDQDSLPEYDLLDRLLKLYVEENYSASMLLQSGFDEVVTKQVIRLVERNEYKRAQCPPIIKLRKKTFGCGRTLPF